MLDFSLTKLYERVGPGYCGYFFSILDIKLFAEVFEVFKSHRFGKRSLAEDNVTHTLGY